MATTMANPTASEKAAVGAETARMEGKGPVGQDVEAVKNVATDRDGPGFGTRTGLGTGLERTGSLSDDEFGHRRHGLLGRSEEEMERLRNRTIVSNEGEAYCPNPNLRDLPKEYETRVQVIQRYPEMRTVEKTDYVKEIVNEERTIIVPKTRVIMDEVEHIDRIPIIRRCPEHGKYLSIVVQEEREVTDMVPVIEYVDTPRIERVPRVIVEDIEERITVPVVREVPVTRMVEVPTGNYCEAPAGEFINPTHFNLLGHGIGHGHGHKTGGILNRTGSSSSSSSDNEHIAEQTTVGTGVNNPLEGGLHHDTTGAPTTVDGTTVTSNPSTPRKRGGLLGRIIHH